jgi:hypothetical protein
MSATIIAKNQTASPIVLDDLGVTIPASGQVTLTDDLRSDEVLGSPSLQTEVLAGNVVLNDGTSDVSLVNSTAWFTGNFSILPGAPPTTRTLYVGIQSSTTSGTFVDAMAGSSITVPETGDYFCIFEGTYQGTANSTQAAVGVGVNSTSVAAATTERAARTQNGATSVVSTAELSLTAGDTVHGLFRRLAGSGTLNLFLRRLTIIRTNLS